MRPFPRGRYPAGELLSAFDRAAVRVVNKTCLLFLQIGAETEIELHFPCGEPWKTRARALLSEISALDNLVQDSCESEAARSNLPIENFELDLAWIELGPTGLTLGYYGAKVNTEWEARFKWANGRWEKENF